MTTPNPLDSVGQKFSVDLQNPNPTSSKTKAGPVYRVSFEIQREPWDAFMSANTDGMVLEAVMQVTALHAPNRGVPAEPEKAAEPKKAADEAPIDKKKYPKANLAGMWCGELIFRSWLAKDLHRDIKGEEAAKGEIKQILGIKSLREIDEKPDVGAEFDKIFRKPFMASRRR